MKLYWLQEVQSFCSVILGFLKAINVAIILQYVTIRILQYAIYQYFLSGVLYCIAVVNIAIYKYIIIILLHP